MYTTLLCKLNIFLYTTKKPVVIFGVMLIKFYGIEWYSLCFKSSSCSLLLCNGIDSSRELRELVGGLVLSDPNKYSAALLGRECGEYVEWLLKDDTWGGEN